MVEETTSEQEEEPVASTETDESVAEPETKPEQETEPEETPEEKTEEKTYTKAQVDEMLTKRIGREKRRLQRDFDEKQVAKPAEVEKGTEEAEPQQDDYETTQEWIKATAKHVLKAELQADKVEQAEQKRLRENQDLNAKFQKMADKFEEKHPDFWDAMDNLRSYQIPGYINEAVQSSDLGAELTYYLSNNTEELETILDLQPSAAVRALGRLEAKLENAPKPKEISKVPDPIKPLKGGSKTGSSEYKAGDSFEQFYKVRNIELGRGKQN